VSLSAALKLGLLPQEQQRAWLAAQPREVLQQIQRGDWWWYGRPEQFAPRGDWLVWLILSGRGWGKSRTGAEWLIDRVLRHPVDALGHRTEWLVIAETLNDARTICLEGNGGILSVLHRLGFEAGRDYKYEKSPRLMLRFTTGQLIYFDGADSADVGRGFNAAGAWIDEMAKFRYTWTAWYEGILPSLRAPLINDHPRTCVTTTPKPIKLLLSWAHSDDGSIVITRGSTFDNRANLSPHVLKELERIYAGTSVGRQELMGELLEEIEGALWKHSQIETDRVKRAPELADIVVGMDPAGSGTGDETGLIAVGRGAEDDEDYVLEDWSQQLSGHPAAIRAWKLFAHVGARRLVVEDNVAKLWLITVLRDAYYELRGEGLFPSGGEPPIKPVTARHGKRLRAEPVASRYEQHRVHHVGVFQQLEDQQVTWVPAETTNSPDRVDALVYADLHLVGKERRRGRILAPSGNPIGASSPYG
jgi:phage terminase large subunit-like protein